MCYRKCEWSHWDRRARRRIQTTDDYESRTQNGRDRENSIVLSKRVKIFFGIILQHLKFLYSGSVVFVSLKSVTLYLNMWYKTAVPCRLYKKGIKIVVRALTIGTVMRIPIVRVWSICTVYFVSSSSVWSGFVSIFMFSTLIGPNEAPNNAWKTTSHSMSNLKFWIIEIIDVHSSCLSCSLR